MEWYITTFLLGVIVGMIASNKLKLGEIATYITNEIGKVKTKGNNSPIDAILAHEQPISPTEKPKPRKGLIRRIFTYKKKNNEQSN